MGKKRVLNVFVAYKLGGVAICNLNMIKNTKSIFDYYTVGHKVLTKQDILLYEDFVANSKACYNLDLTVFSFKTLVDLVKLCYKLRPNIVHVNGKGGALYGFLLRLLYWNRFRLIYAMHGFHKKYYGIMHCFHMVFEFLLSRIVTKSVAVSFSEREYYLHMTKAVASKTIVIPNGVEVNEANLPDEIASIVNGYDINIVSLSRIDFQKDLYTMLKAFDKLNDGKVALHIIGGFVQDRISYIQYKEELDRYLKTLSCQDRVFFWGDVPYAGNLLHNFDIYWSTAIFEGLPTSIIEAMMSKILVVATNCRGNVDLVKEEKTGFITEMKDVESNCKQIKRAIANISSQQVQTIITNAYEQSQQYRISKNISKIVKIYCD